MVMVQTETNAMNKKKAVYQINDVPVCIGGGDSYIGLSTLLFNGSSAKG
jgi:hypothetical protein